MDPPVPATTQIEQRIRAYLQAHPRAIDTERGIREWWLRDMHPPPAPRDVAAAVEALVATGALLPLTLPDGRVALQAAGPSHPGQPPPTQ